MRKEGETAGCHAAGAVSGTKPSTAQKSKRPHVLRFTGFRVQSQQCRLSAEYIRHLCLCEQLPATPSAVLRNTLPRGPPTPTTAGLDPVLLCTCFRLPGSVTHTNMTSSTQRTLRSHVLHFSSHLMVPFSIYHRKTV